MATKTQNGTPAVPSSLESRVRQDEARLAADERRLELDEARLTADEARLRADEDRLRREELSTQRNWWAILGVAGLVILTITSLILSIVALNQHIDSVEAAKPQANSVGTAALQSSSVTSDKLAENSVTASALASGSVLNRHLGGGAVNGTNVASNSLTGADINERTLGKVPAAATADTADTAGNAAALGGFAAGKFLAGTKYIFGSSRLDSQPVKTVTVTAPVGYRVIGGGASIEGTPGKVAILSSAPAGKTAWTAVAGAINSDTGAWKLNVTVIVAAQPR